MILIGIPGTFGLQAGEDVRTQSSLLAEQRVRPPQARQMRAAKQIDQIGQ